MAQPQSAAARVAKIPPILSFSDQEQFRATREDATKAEFKIQQTRVDAFTKHNAEFAAWAITAPPVGQPWMPYIFRVKLNSRLPKGVEFPGVGQNCKLRLVDAERNHSSWYLCRRGAEVIPLNQSWSDLSELMVYVLDQDQDNFGDCLTPLIDGSSSVRSLQNKHAKSIKVQLQLEASKATMLAELGALDRLMKGNVSKAGKTAFSYIMKFSNPTELFDLTASFPHLADLDDIPDDTLRAALKEITDGFDQDQKQALASLSALPGGICFVPGGPGSGKTGPVLASQDRG